MSKPALLTWWPVLVSAAMALVSAATMKAAVDELRRVVEVIDQRQQAHERAAGHPEGLARLRAVEAESAKSAQTIEAVHDRLRAIDINLALVCRATKGADCVR